jgi:hypothetical protein
LSVAGLPIGVLLTPGRWVAGCRVAGPLIVGLLASGIQVAG